MKPAAVASGLGAGAERAYVAGTELAHWPGAGPAPAGAKSLPVACRLPASRCLLVDPLSIEGGLESWRTLVKYDSSQADFPLRFPGAHVTRVRLYHKFDPPKLKQTGSEPRLG